MKVERYPVILLPVILCNGFVMDEARLLASVPLFQVTHFTVDALTLCHLSLILRAKRNLFSLLFFYLHFLALLTVGEVYKSVL